ncbi:hypothetical protein HDE68_004198 [Pedobacter cryoconitis]|uniref:Gliding motility protein RemB n=1 Tax=Pedobacter cryoconitis TaxID=188932 RepID=A0A7W8ZQD4_9SPHI|nr:gliding motility protein RemB [Pedobacter cryoconitis]MBB5638269.1 hypothetical protein [Pedobacter cryoconitis]
MKQLKYNYSDRRERLISLALFFILMLMKTEQGNAQLIFQPYSYQFYQKLNKTIYSSDINLHTAIKPYFISDSSYLRPLYDSLTTNHRETTKRNFIQRILFDQHLVDVKNKDYTFYLDFLPDFQLGRSFNEKTTTWLNTRGFQLGITIGSKFFIYTSGYENQGKFTAYEDHYINQTGMVPGQGYDKNQGAPTKDWSYVTTLIGYTPTKAITIALGQDKTFIGDGYRSLLLSDNSAPYPMLRFTANLGKKIQYMAMWAYMEDQKAPQFNSFYNNRRKWGAFHYIDWNITNKTSLGFFNALIVEEATDQGKLHGFDLNYINPILFSSALRPAGTTPDHTLIGFNGKYKVLTKTTAYGQMVFDQSTGNSNYAWQLGLRGSDLLKINRLNYLFEYNTAKPNTYSSAYSIVNYTELSEPLAHPLGAGFKEWLGIVNYSIHKFDFQGQINYAHYTLNQSGQELASTLKYAEGKVAYLLNPKYNFRLEISGLLRQEKNSLNDNKTNMITFGLRSSFRNLYHDF